MWWTKFQNSNGCGPNQIAANGINSTIGSFNHSINYTNPQFYSHTSNATNPDGINQYNNLLKNLQSKSSSTSSSPNSSTSSSSSSTSSSLNENNIHFPFLTSGLPLTPNDDSITTNSNSQYNYSKLNNLQMMQSNSSSMTSLLQNDKTKLPNSTKDHQFNLPILINQGILKIILFIYFISLYL